MRALVCVLLMLSVSATADARPRARSLGDNSTGHMEGGRSLPLRSPSLRVISRTVERGFTFGTDELVGAIVDAADAVREALPGAILRVGNLSREGGGDIGPSRSHNSGRDADIGFYVTDTKGAAAHPDSLVALGRDGRSRDGRYRLDVARSWALVRALLTSDKVQLEWAFCAAWLREPLLEHARAVEKDPGLVVRAEVVLKQPSDSSVHDDHFHVRIYCEPEDQADGCNGYGATWPWVDPAREVLDARALELGEQALAGAGRARALNALITARGRAAVPMLLPLLGDAGARDGVLRLIRATRATEAAGALGERLQATTDAGAQDALVATLASLGHRAAGPLSSFVARSDATSGAVVRSLGALGSLGDASVVPRLVTLVGSSDRAISDAAQGALARITNHEEPAGSRSGAGDKGGDGWSRWWEAHRGGSRDAWVEEGFRQAGIPATGYVKRVEALIKAVGSADSHVSWNAQRELAGLTGLDLGARTDGRAAAKAWAEAWKNLRPMLAGP